MHLVLVVLMGMLLGASGPVAAAGPARDGGISKAEAAGIAARFFANEIAVDGAVGKPALNGEHWAFPVKIGYARAVHRDPLLVHRVTGKVSWAGLDEYDATLGRYRSRTPK